MLLFFSKYAQKIIVSSLSVGSLGVQAGLC